MQGRIVHDILILSEEKKRVVLERHELKGLHPAIAGRIIRIAWEGISGSLKDLNRCMWIWSLDIVSKEGNRTAELPKKVSNGCGGYNRVEFHLRASCKKPDLFQ